MDILLWVGVFIGSLAFLIKSSDYFIEYAEKVGLGLGLSPTLIGTIILAFGTSLPELVTSVLAVLENSSEIVLGNVVGSNIANVLMVGGTLLVAAKSHEFNLRSFRGDMIVVALASVLLWLFAYNRFIELYEAVILIVIYFAYLTYSLRYSTNPELDEELKKLEAEAKEPIKWYYWLIMLGSAAGIYLGAEYTVKAIINLSEILKIGKDVISLSAVALGTSLPELVVSLLAARKGQMDLAIGNILGSNIFNILAIISIPRFIGSLTITSSIVDVSIPVMAVVALIFIALLVARRLSIWIGIVLVFLYLLYNVELFSNVFTKAMGL